MSENAKFMISQILCMLSWVLLFRQCWVFHNFTKAESFPVRPLYGDCSGQGIACLFCALNPLGLTNWMYTQLGEGGNFAALSLSSCIFFGDSTLRPWAVCLSCVTVDMRDPHQTQGQETLLPPELEFWLLKQWVSLQFYQWYLQHFLFCQWPVDASKLTVKWLLDRHCHCRGPSGKGTGVFRYNTFSRYSGGNF